MTSKERHEARFQRRKAAREAARKERLRDALDFDRVFTYRHLYRCAWLCFKGVRWKGSVQAYKARCGINVARRLQELRSGVFKLRKAPEFYTWERGKLRKINSIHIDDRVPQKCACVYSLKPVLHPTLIYDNYSSQEGKGTDKARKRVKCMLERHIRKYGMAGGVIIWDFRHFFDSIRHDLARHVLDRYYEDKRLIGLNMKIVRHCRKDVGLVLGSENSQDFAISTPSAMDHYIKERLGVEGYGRYADDGIIIHPDFEYLKEVWTKMKAFAARLGFELNARKSRLLRFGTEFAFLKRKYTFADSGHIVVRPARCSVVRERRKLKRLHHKFLLGEVPFSTCDGSVRAWKASVSDAKRYKIEESIDQLFDKLFIWDWLNGKEHRKACTTRSYPKDRLSMCAMV